MSNRLNSEREKILEPKRLSYAAEEVTALGYTVKEFDKHLTFIFKGEIITLWPYSGWHTGKSIKDGRGLHRLLDQIKPKGGRV